MRTLSTRLHILLLLASWAICAVGFDIARHSLWTTASDADIESVVLFVPSAQLAPPIIACATAGAIYGVGFAFLTKQGAIGSRVSNE